MFIPLRLTGWKALTIFIGFGLLTSGIQEGRFISIVAGVIFFAGGIVWLFEQNSDD